MYEEDEEIKEKFHFYKIKRDDLPAKIEGYSNYTCETYKTLELPENYVVDKCNKLGYTSSPIVVTCIFKEEEEEEEEPTTANIVFSTTPPNAAVRVDGVLIGNT